MQPADILIIVFPCMALLLLGLSVAGFYYWWTATKGDEPQTETNIKDADTNDGKTLGDLFGGSKQKPTKQESAKPADPPQPARQPQAVPVVTQTTGTTTVVTTSPLNENTVEVMRVLRDISDGAIVIEINGKQYYSLKEITDPKVGRRFLGNAQAVAEFAHLKNIGGKRMRSKSVLPPAEPAVPRPPSIDKPDIESSSPAQNLELYDPLTDPQPKTVGTLRDSLLGNIGTDKEPATSVARPTEPVSPSREQREEIKAFEPPSRSMGAEAQEQSEEVKARSIADEIEEILQLRLREHPEYRFRVMHIRQAPDGGVRVEVNGQFFEGVGEVSDEGARAFIQSVIREWEARQ